MFKELIQYYLDYFNETGELALRVFCNLDVPSKLLLEKYKQFPPIETLPEHENKELKKYVIEMFPNKSPQEKIQSARIIYCIGCLI